MTCRKSVAAMLAAGEETAYVNAILLLKNSEPSIIPQAQADGATSRYDDYAWLHKAAFSLIHVGPAFGPWHRELLRQFELDLRDAASDDSISIPYWDWPNGNSSGDAGWPFVLSLMGGLGTGPGFAVQTGPFAGSTGDWPINVRDSGDTHTVLRRVATTSASSSNIPSAATTRTALSAQPYDSVPYNSNSFPTGAQAAASFRKSLEFFLHNGPHNWVGNENPDFLDMMAAASPNDPIFFLHHAAIDRIWQIWQERQGVAPSATFAPLSGANSGHDLNDVMSIMDSSFFKWPVLNTNAATLDLHAAGVWYDSDVPEVTLQTPTVNFGTIPAGMTTYRPVQFEVQGCRLLNFRITGISSGAFFIPPGNTTAPFPASDDPAARTADVFLACSAPSDGSPVAPGSVVIEAYVVDADGYLTGTVGADFVIDTYNATLSAAVEPRKTSAVAFVSDRSGSMSGTAGAGLTRFQLLEEALEVATDLLDPADSAALVFFDSAVSTPLSIATVGTGVAIEAALNDPAIQPNFGSTAIGSGLIAGASELNAYIPPAGVVDPNLAIVCLTDGNENVAPLVLSAPVTTALASYANDVYAIGLGTENGVSADTLGAISTYMLVTGDHSADARRFMVTKYFVQIIADVKQANIIVDPDGSLFPGLVHEVPFDVTEADVSVDVVLISAHAKLIDLQVVTPGGDVLSLAALGPNASLRANRLDTILSIGLPALPGSPASSHAGRWVVRLRLGDSKSFRENLLTESAMASFASRPSDLRAGVPYTVLVETRSNLTLRVGRNTPRILPGGTLPLAVSLSQYGVPLASAQVTVRVTDPHGQSFVHRLNPTAGNLYVGSVAAPLSGTYTCRIISSGTSFGGRRFTREATRTFAVGPVTPAFTSTQPDCPPDQLCGVLACLLKDKAVRKFLDSLGVDRKQLAKCLELACKDPKLPEVPKESDAPCKEASKLERQQADMQPEQVLQLLRMVATASGVDALALPPVQPVAPPHVDPALFDAPMFMPVMAWDDDGNVVHVGGHTGGMDMPKDDDDEPEDCGPQD